MSFTGLLPALTSMQSGEMARHGAASGGGLYASILTFVGLGAVVGNLATAGVSNKRMLARIYAVTAVASGLTLSLLALTHQAWMMIGVGFLVGGTQAVFMASSSALVMQRTEPSYQGRVSSVYIIFAAGLMAVCNLGYGTLGTVIDPSVIMVVTGLSFTVLFAVIGMLSTLRHTLDTPDIARPSSGLTL
jgi:MFS family permease